MHTRPVWVEISRRNLISNYLELRRTARAHLLPGSNVAVLGVVKADAYGHGMIHCAPLLVTQGAEWIGITSVEEGVNAREVCPEARILVMSGIWHGEADAVLEHRLTPIVWESFHLDLLEAAAQRRGLPSQSVPVHLELDTGMSRQGVQTSGSGLPDILRRFHPLSTLRLEGIATHFSAPEVLHGEETGRQMTRFETALELVGAQGLRPGWVHAGNSATLLRGEQILPLQRAASRMGARLMLRPGLSLYGYAPRFSEAGSTVCVAENDDSSARLLPVLSWKTRVTSLRSIEAGDSVGYNSIFRAARRTRLALLPIGYADGLNRLLSNRGCVLIRGQRAPIAGRISMDQTIVDVSDLPEVEIGDEVVLIGSQGKGAITAYDLADLAKTIPFEVLCGIGRRVPRLPVE